MMRKRLLVALAVFFTGVALAAAGTSTVLAKDPFVGVDCNKGQGSALCTGKTSSDENPLTGPNGTIRRATEIVARIAGITAVIIIMVAGFMYITAGGEASKVSEAKNAIIYASVGLVVIVLGQYIIIFVLSKVK